MSVIRTNEQLVTEPSALYVRSTVGERGRHMSHAKHCHPTAYCQRFIVRLHMHPRITQDYVLEYFCKPLRSLLFLSQYIL